MAHVEDHAPFTPSWIDIGTDVEASKAFYTVLFGWETQEAGPVEETGGYGFFNKAGRMIGGYGPQQNPGPPFWSTYISVPDADEVAKKVEAAGGTVVAPKMQVMESGSMAVFQDDQGAFISVWQPALHTGAKTVREAGSFSWCDLNTRDIPKAKAFYNEVFGWGAESHEGDMPYTEFKVDGVSIAGLREMSPETPAAVPPFWLVYLGSDDVDITTSKATELGGSVMVPPMDFPGGRFSVLVDPQGATFGVLQPDERA